MRKTLVFLLLATLLALPSALAQDLSNPDLVCPDEEPDLSLTRYVRGLSLDLRGVVPTLEEYQQVLAVGPKSVPGTTATFAGATSALSSRRTRLCTARPLRSAIAYTRSPAMRREGCAAACERWSRSRYADHAAWMYDAARCFSLYRPSFCDKTLATRCSGLESCECERTTCTRRTIAAKGPYFLSTPPSGGAAAVASSSSSSAIVLFYPSSSLLIPPCHSGLGRLLDPEAHRVD